MKKTTVLYLVKKFEKFMAIFTATLNATHPTPERAFCGRAVSRPEECVRPCTKQKRPAAVRMNVKGAL